jgi:REP-associated tyrosine transposase
MTEGLIRLQHAGQTHFVTFSCYRRETKLTTPLLRALFLETLEKTRQKFSLRVYGYVVMPEHVHLLLSEPASGTLAGAIHFLKLSSAKQKESDEQKATGHFWQKRYYDRNIRSYSDFTEKLRYIHRNPVKRGLCENAEDWPWSSFHHYAVGELGVVEIESEWTARRRTGEEPGMPEPRACCFPP